MEEVAQIPCMYIHVQCVVSDPCTLGMYVHTTHTPTDLLLSYYFQHKSCSAHACSAMYLTVHVHVIIHQIYKD